MRARYAAAMSRVAWTVLIVIIVLVLVLIAAMMWLNTPTGFQVVGEPDGGLRPASG